MNFDLIKERFKPNLLIFFGILFATFSQFTLVAVVTRNLDSRNLSYFLVFIWGSTIIGLFLASPAMTIATISHGQMGEIRPGILPTLKGYSMIASVVMMISGFIWFIAENQSVAIVIMFVSVSVQIQTISSIQRGYFASNELWKKVFLQLFFEAGIKLLISWLVYIHWINHVSIILLGMLTAQLIPFFLQGPRRSYYGSRIKLGLRESIRTLLPIWAQNAGAQLVLSIPILLGFFNTHISITDINSMALIFMVARIPLSFTSAILTPLLVNLRKTDDKRIALSGNGVLSAIAAIFLFLVGFSFILKFTLLRFFLLESSLLEILLVLILLLQLVSVEFIMNISYARLRFNPYIIAWLPALTIILLSSVMLASKLMILIGMVCGAVILNILCIWKSVDLFSDVFAFMRKRQIP